MRESYTGGARGPFKGRNFLGRSDRDASSQPQPITDRYYKFTFGKYNGQTLDEVLRGENPGYLSWLHHNSRSFELSADLLAEAEGDEGGIPIDRYREPNTAVVTPTPMPRVQPMKASTGRWVWVWLPDDAPGSTSFDPTVDGEVPW